jgi:hypothetical protein
MWLAALSIGEGINNVSNYFSLYSSCDDLHAQVCSNIQRWVGNCKKNGDNTSDINPIQIDFLCQFHNPERLIIRLDVIEYHI